jgi:hypothetical protein
MGTFLLLAAVRELRAAPQAATERYAAPERRVFKRRSAANATHGRARFIIRRSRASAASVSRYNLLLVLDEDMEVIGQLDEEGC